MCPYGTFIVILAATIIVQALHDQMTLHDSIYMKHNTQTYRTKIYYSDPVVTPTVLKVAVGRKDGY